MEPEIAFLRCDRTIDGWVNDVPQVEIIAELLYNLVVPRPARLPCEIQIAASRLFEEPPEVRNIFLRLPKLCRTLKKDGPCLQSLSTRQRRFQTFGHYIRRLKKACLVCFLFVELFSLYVYRSGSSIRG